MSSLADIINRAAGGNMGSRSPELPQFHVSLGPSGEGPGRNVLLSLPDSEQGLAALVVTRLNDELRGQRPRAIHSGVETVRAAVAVLLAKMVSAGEIFQDPHTRRWKLMDALEGQILAVLYEHPEYVEGTRVESQIARPHDSIRVTINAEIPRSALYADPPGQPTGTLASLARAWRKHREGKLSAAEFDAMWPAASRTEDAVAELQAYLTAEYRAEQEALLKKVTLLDGEMENLPRRKGQ